MRIFLVHSNIFSYEKISFYLYFAYRMNSNESYVLTFFCFSSVPYCQWFLLRSQTGLMTAMMSFVVMAQCFMYSSVAFSDYIGDWLYEIGKFTTYWWWGRRVRRTVLKLKLFPIINPKLYVRRI